MFKIENALVYQIFSKVFMDMDAYVHVKQMKNLQDGQAVYFAIHKQFLLARQATEVKRKLQTSHDDGKKKGWDWGKYVALHKEQHAIMESLTDYGYSGTEKGTKFHHFLQGIKCTELEAAVNFVWA